MICSVQTSQVVTRLRAGIDGAVVSLLITVVQRHGAPSVKHFGPFASRGPSSIGPPRSTPTPGPSDASRRSLGSADLHAPYLAPHFVHMHVPPPRTQQCALCSVRVAPLRFAACRFVLTVAALVRSFPCWRPCLTRAQNAACLPLFFLALRHLAT